MDYQTLKQAAENTVSDVVSWFSADPITNGMFVVIGIAVLGAINGIRCSLNRCKFTGRGQMRIL